MFAKGTLVKVLPLGVHMQGAREESSSGKLSLKSSLESSLLEPNPLFSETRDTTRLLVFLDISDSNVEEREIFSGISSPDFHHFFPPEIQGHTHSSIHQSSN